MLSRDPPRRGRPAREALDRRDRDDRHPVRVPRHRRDHRRLPARQPDHRRRPPGDGQERPGRQHRRKRRRQAKTSRSPSSRSRCRRSSSPSASSPAGRGSPATSCARARSPSATGRRWSRACNELEEAPLWFDDSSDLGILDLRAKARRLHAQEQDRGGLGLIILDYMQLMRCRRPPRQPGRAGRPDQPRAEDPRPRARGPGDRDLPALPRARAADAAEAAALRPARVGPDRAGRRPRRLPLPRGLLPRPRRGARRPRRADHRQAQERPDRDQEAGLPRPLSRSSPTTAARSADRAARRRRAAAGRRAERRAATF